MTSISFARPGAGLYVARWPDAIRIMDIALLPAFHGRGVGTHLLGDLQSEASAAGRPLRIHVERFNPALNLYARLGFHLVEDRGVYLFLEWPPDGASSPPTARPATRPVSSPSPNPRSTSPSPTSR
jgi:hypothetical protein